MRSEESNKRSCTGTAYSGGPQAMGRHRRSRAGDRQSEKLYALVSGHGDIVQGAPVPPGWHTAFSADPTTQGLWFKVL